LEPNRYSTTYFRVPLSLSWMRCPVTVNCGADVLDLPFVDLNKYNTLERIKMEKIFTLSDESFQEEFLNIFAIGLLECLKNDLIDVDRAEQWLFSPVAALSMSEEKFSKQFIDAMKYASELDACRNSDYYQKSVFTSEQLFYEALKSGDKSHTSTNPLKMIISGLE